MIVYHPPRYGIVTSKGIEEYNLIVWILSIQDLIVEKEAIHGMNDLLGGCIH